MTDQENEQSAVEKVAVERQVAEHEAAIARLRLERVRDEREAAKLANPIAIDKELSLARIKLELARIKVERAAAERELSKLAEPRTLEEDAATLARVKLERDNTERELAKPSWRRWNTAAFGAFVIELSKVVLGGWPVFCLVLVMAFYAPLRDTLKSIPKKVEAADEIQGLGVSLKSTFKRVAAAEGLAALGETVPKLSTPALELLLRAPRRQQALVTFYASDDGQYYSTVKFPSSRTIKALAELQAKGLVHLEGGIGKSSDPMDTLNAEQVERLPADIREHFPGSDGGSSDDDQVGWKLHVPIRTNNQALPRLWWSLTDSGVQAAGIVFKAVSASLVSTPDKEGKQEQK